MDENDYEKRSLEQIFGKRSDIRPRKKISEVTRRAPAGRTTGGLKLSRSKETQKSDAFFESPLSLRERTHTSMPNHERSGVGKKVFLFFVVAVVLTGVGFIGTYMFGQVRVIVTPKTFTTPAQISTLVYETPPASTLISFETVSKETVKTADVVAVGSEYREIKASGTIKIFNTSGTAQTLSPETRFTGSNGKIYKTGPTARITISGGTKANPGTREVVVYASEPGPDANAPLQDFTIPGFKGSPKFATIIARSVTPITGGVKGTIPTVSETTRKEAEKKLLAELDAQSLVSVREQVPEGFVLLSGGAISGKPAITIEATESGARLSATRKDVFVIFKEDELTTFLASKLIPSFNPEKDTVRVRSFDEVALVLGSQAVTITEKIPVSFSGNVSFEWVTNSSDLQSALLGIPRKSLPDALKPFDTIERADVYFTPIWLLSIPSEAEKIQISTAE